MKYRLIPHTSDLGMEIYGKTIEELFTNALVAITDNISVIENVDEALIKMLNIEGEDLEDLFMNWLRELVYIFATDYFLAKRVIKLEISPEYKRLSAVIGGEKFNPNKHTIKIEIKTPTYHLFSIKKEESGYKATVIFDV